MGQNNQNPQKEWNKSGAQIMRRFFIFVSLHLFLFLLVIAYQAQAKAEAHIQEEEWSIKKLDSMSYARV